MGKESSSSTVDPKYWSLIIGHVFFVFDFWPLAIDIDFAFWPTTSGCANAAVSALMRTVIIFLSLYICLSLCVCVLPAVRLRKLQTPLWFCFSSVCVFFFLFFALLCVPHFDHELEANLVCLSFQWARQKPNSDSVSNSNSPIQFLFVTHSNVLFDWASNGLSGFNLGYITEGWKRVPYRESFSLCDKKSIPLAQSKRVHPIKTEWDHNVSLTSIVALVQIWSLNENLHIFLKLYTSNSKPLFSN